MNTLCFIVTNYNYSSYLGQCIESIKPFLNASYKCIIVDDGSSDSSMDFLDSIVDDNILIIKSFNNGLEVAANLGILHSNSEFICRVDADDRLLSSFIPSIQPYLNHDFDVIYGNYNQINSATKIIKSVELPAFDRKEIQERGDFLATGTVIRRSFIGKAGYYPVRKKNCGLENFEVILNLIQGGAVFKKIDAPIFEYRIHDGSIGQTRQASIISYGQELSGRFGLGPYKTNKYHPYELLL